MIFKVAECKTRSTPPPLSFNGKEVRTAVNADFESSIFVEAHLDRYGPESELVLAGTISSSLLMVDQDGGVHYFERVYD